MNNTTFLKEDGSLDSDRINLLPYEKYMEVMGSLTENQIGEYLSAFPINESTEPVKEVMVDYTLDDELKAGAVIAGNYIRNKREELKRKS